MLILVNFACSVCSLDNLFYTPCSLLCTLLKELEVQLLLDSEQTMHLWTLAKYIKEIGEFDDPDMEENFNNAMDKMDKLETHFFRIYQKYIEDQDRQKIKKLQ